MNPMGDFANATLDPIFVSQICRKLDADYCWDTGDLMGPFTKALTLAGAARAGAGDFRALGANSGLLRSPVGRDFQVWALPGRKARE